MNIRLKLVFVSHRGGSGGSVPSRWTIFFFFEKIAILTQFRWHFKHLHSYLKLKELNANIWKPLDRNKFLSLFTVQLLPLLPVQVQKHAYLGLSDFIKGVIILSGSARSSHQEYLSENASV